MPHASRDHQNFHVGLKAFIEKDEKLLILQDNRGEWELPGGRVEKRERNKDLKTILTRETTEELGENIKLEIGPVFHNWIRVPPQNDRVYKNTDFTIFLVGFRCTYVGGEISLSPEHKNFKWINRGDVKKLKFENTYQEAVEYYFKNNS